LGEEQPTRFHGRNLRLQVTIAAFMPDQYVVPNERVERSILILRGHRVILDSDLAYLYGVTVKRLNAQVKRNIDRFPDDFAFTLTEEEHEASRSQFATLKNLKDACMCQSRHPGRADQDTHVVLPL
jgi:hypothetical protein